MIKYQNFQNHFILFLELVHFAKAYLQFTFLVFEVSNQNHLNLINFYHHLIFILFKIQNYYVHIIIISLSVHHFKFIIIMIYYVLNIINYLHFHYFNFIIIKKENIVVLIFTNLNFLGLFSNLFVNFLNLNLFLFIKFYYLILTMNP